MVNWSKVVVEKCDRCGEVACFDVCGNKGRCQSCNRIGALTPGTQPVVMEEGEHIESLVERTNPHLWSNIQTRRNLAAQAMVEADCGMKMRRYGASWRLALARLDDAADDPATPALRGQLEEWENLSLYEQRDLLVRVDAHVTDTLRARRAIAFLHGIAPSMPGRWTPLRIVLPMAGIFSLLSTLTLVAGDADVSLAWMIGLIGGPLVILPVASLLLYAARLRGWFRDEFIPLAQERGLELPGLIRLLELAERIPSLRVDTDVRLLAYERFALIALINEDGAAIRRLASEHAISPMQAADYRAA